MAVLRKKSPWPIYLVAALWIIWALFFPMYALSHFIVLFVLSAAVYTIGRFLWKDTVIKLPEPPPEPETTGNETLDNLIAERDRAVSEMRRLNDSIKDAKISAQIDELETLTRKIVAHAVEHPAKLPQLRKFFNYYLPTTLKLLNAYDRMDAAGISGTNIDGTMGKIEAMMDNVILAFNRQLDALFADEALDISTDITVMENMLAREGIGGEQITGNT